MQHQRRFAIDPPRRVLALGSPGSGRARIIELLASRFGLPIVTLDHEKRVIGHDASAWRRRVAELAQTATWAMMGNDSEALDLPVRRADWLIFLNLPMSVCLMRVVRAALGGAGAADVGGGLWRAVKEVWEFPTEIAPHVAQAIERERRNRTIFILHSNRDVSRFVAKLPDPDSSSQGPSKNGAPPAGPA
jgi:adenylate kinase family enzyme